MENFEIECLEAHNKYRKIHGVPPLELDSTLSKFSKEWADYLIKNKLFEHSRKKGYGENLYVSQSSDPNHTISGAQAVDSWYDEIKLYTYQEPAPKGTGHFTQVVWKNSDKLGVGFAKKGGTIMVVCNYTPQGNYIRDHSENVFRPNTSPILTPSTESVTKKLQSLTLPQEPLVDEAFQSDFLNMHNYYRKKHGVAPLKLDERLCNYSEEYARILISSNQVIEEQGKSVFWNKNKSNRKLLGGEIVRKWYRDEINKHIFGREKNLDLSRHFAQIVWESSKTIGVGTAMNSEGDTVVVATYHPPGNIPGEVIKNVPPVKPAYAHLKN